MAIRGYVLVETEVGRTDSVRNAIRALKSKSATITSVDSVTGPFDVIVQLAAEDLDSLAKIITDDLQLLEGVQRTTTCLSLNL
ncbi:MAG: AsnC family transcriptional regulator [Chloroflexi bacterium]|nr:AsnC family transcriptional regulator [Chloroflexota bacterium]|tara:strand:+ start:11893 stop:12141 length:249 start_codon:yes stop_codon:yes gene_type:complete